MKVLLLRNVREAANLSMKLYADRIAEALGGRCRVESLRPWSPPRSDRPGLRLVSKGLDYLARYAVYAAQARGARADVFHVVDHAYAHLLAALPAGRTVVTCHDLMLLKLARSEFGPGFPRYRVATALLRLSLRLLPRAAAVVATSRATAEDLARHLALPPDRVRVIHHGVDALFQPPPHPDARRQSRERLGLPDARAALLHVGNNWFYKNLEGLLEALALFGDGASAPVLLKVGKGLTHAQRARARALGVLDRVVELGPLGAEALRAVYWAADALVFPSLWEGFGWPVLEAMACGLPVVCSDRGGLAEVAGDAAVIVKPEDPRDIAAGVERVLRDAALRRDLVARGLEQVKAFTWAQAGDRLLELYRELRDSAEGR